MDKYQTIYTKQGVTPVHLNLYLYAYITIRLHICAKKEVVVLSVFLKILQKPSLVKRSLLYFIVDGKKNSFHLQLFSMTIWTYCEVVM